jgi:hypothetical protein
LSTHFLDGNVLIALTDSAHVHHPACVARFGAGRSPFATCPTTQGISQNRPQRDPALSHWGRMGCSSRAARDHVDKDNACRQRFFGMYRSVIVPS